MALTYMNVACFCGLNKFKVAFLTSSLPVSTDMCHCNSCRHNTGQTFVHTVTIINDPLSPGASETDAQSKAGDLQHLAVYKPAESLTRYFCSRCFAYVFTRVSLDDGSYRWNVFTGVLEKVGGIVKVGYHSFVGDTQDGGIADHYRAVDGVDLPRYKLSKRDGDLVAAGWKAANLQKAQESPLQEGETLSAHCHCKAISLSFTPVTAISDPENEWWLVPPKNEQSHVRYLGLHCVCDSCRLTSGSLIQSWVYIPRVNIIDTHTSRPVVLVPKEGESRTAGLTQFESIPGTYRESCAKCGAKVFFWKTSRGADVLDVSAGLFDQEQEGARADRWFGWAQRVSFHGFAIDASVADSLESGLKVWEDRY
ncbi:hypothetical protein GALMADRAFT_1182683 [Galerina marginata CBS 339.88]|uniref:CENP-V/GFA domain-containing protein n=1 Tax=Galerina marginata (strain CBS 339.88) TaxID=685588 RepID=A0A067TAC2_GALM3|nr:hypothetical protein GALMADRAFT_1182683 [Galerina marginata CBS 339.88]